MSGIPLRFRQIHLDFHTSEAIEGIGADFDPEEFAETLSRARVNSVTCFGRCHHGWIYYETQRFPERRHPHLQRNLLKEQIEACHARDIRVPIYITVQWDHYTARHHPEWLAVDPNGRWYGPGPYEPGFYRRLCLNTPYREFLKEHVAELFEVLPAVDGLFFDIVHALDCSCRYCQEGMRQAGLEPSRESDRKAFGRRVLEEWIQEMSAFVRSFDPEVTIFYNAGHVGPSHRSVADAYTHWEIESLPSGGWGYLHFPIAIRYARTLKRESLGMTGKFHTSWGDFHSFKNRAALEFECFQMLAHGAKCSVGDQLHPRGRICPVTYELIGSVYRQVEEKEPWCAGATPVAEIAVLTPEEFTGERIPAPSAGATRILQEGRHQFDFVDTSADLSPYRVAILPDGIPVTGALGEKLRAFLNAGGAILASHRSGLTPEGDAFALPEWGVRYLGEAPYSPDFILPSGAIGEGLPETEHVMYLRASHVRATQGTEVLAETIVPYFNRTYAHFCSHRHTPSSGQRGYPAITQRGSVIYFAHPIFTQYHENAPRWCRMLVLNALRRLLPQPLLQVNGPTTLIATLTAQETENRWIVHLLHYVPERRGSRFDVIEDVIPIYDIAVQVRTLRPVESVRCVPEGRTLSYQSAGGAVQFTVPEVVGHQMVELSFRE